jgi:hypothetical protein
VLSPSSVGGSIWRWQCGLFCSILGGILDLFASIVCEQIVRVAANYQIGHDR